jgi:hypothetical protein
MGFKRKSAWALSFLLLLSGCGQTGVLRAKPPIPEVVPNTSDQSRKEIESLFKEYAAQLTQCMPSLNRTGSAKFFARSGQGYYGAAAPQSTGAPCDRSGEVTVQMREREPLFSEGALAHWLAGMKTWAYQREPDKNLNQEVLLQVWVANRPPAPLPDPTCPTATLGAVVNCTAAGCYGHWKLCGEKGSLGSVSRAITKFYLTPLGAHLKGNNLCGADLLVGTTPDCGKGVCDGVRAFCVQETDVDKLRPGSQVVQAIEISKVGLHQNAPPCPVGYTGVGGFPDCALGQCFGNQRACVKMITL